MQSKADTSTKRTALLLGRATDDLARLFDALSERGIRTVSIRPEELTAARRADYDLLLASQDEASSDPALREQLTDWASCQPVMMIEGAQLRTSRSSSWSQPDGLIDQIIRFRDSDKRSSGLGLSRPGLSIWVLAASIGGPEALRQFLSGVRGPVEDALVLVQHIGEEFVRQLVRQLDETSELPVRLVQQGDLITPGTVHVIPGSERFEIDCMGQCSFSVRETVSRFTPCIDDTVDALNQSFWGQLNIMVFSGMSTDGVAAALKVAEQGGEVWIQEPSSCVVSSMVDGVAALHDANYIGTPEALASRFCQRDYLSQQESKKNGTHSS